MDFKPTEKVLWVTKTLIDNGFQAYYVGGAIRDSILGRPYKDIDVATNALPSQIEGLFLGLGWSTAPTGIDHGTITIVWKGLPVCEVTTFRKDISTDGRRATIQWASTVEEDLSRRDFTMNALALDAKNNKLIDSFNGLKDINERTIRCVGEAAARFKEDYLRILRAYRFQSQLGFRVDSEAKDAARKHSLGLKIVSWERKRDELLKLLGGRYEGVYLALEELRVAGAIPYLLPEMLPTIGCTQNIYHQDDVWTHSILAASAMRKRTDDPELVLAALLHDIGKPATKGEVGVCKRCKVRGDRGQECKTCCLPMENTDATFYGHDSVGASISERQLRQLRLPIRSIERITALIRYHLFHLDSETWESKCSDKTCNYWWRSHYTRYMEERPGYLPVKEKCPRCGHSTRNSEKITNESSLSAIRRLVRDVGGERAFFDLLWLRESDREGNRKKRGQTFHHEIAKRMYEAAVKDDAALKIKDLALDGNDLKIMGFLPGPVFGDILNHLLEKVLEDPILNQREKLVAIVEEKWQIVKDH